MWFVVGRVEQIVLPSKGVAAPSAGESRA
jgi:hypothetical protein